MSPVGPLNTNTPLFILGILALLGIFAYGLFVATPYLLGPSLSIISPKEGSTVRSPTVVVQGVTERVSYLSINDLPVPLLEDGTFAVERAFPKGYTVVVVRARDRFNREITETIRFIHETNVTIHGTKKESSGIETGRTEE